MVLAPSKSYLTSKAGPLPIWAWMGVGLGGALGYALYKSHKATSGANAAGNLAGTPGYTLPSNIQPQNTSINEVDYSQVIQGTRRDHPPGGGRPAGRGTESADAGHGGPDNPDGQWVTATPDGPNRSITGILQGMYGSDQASIQTFYNAVVQDPRNADALQHMGRDGRLPPGLSVWIPARAAEGPPPPPPGHRPGDHGRGDARRGGPRTGPGPMPVQNAPRDSDDRGRGMQQQRGGGGYKPGGQRANTYGGR